MLNQFSKTIPRRKRERKEVPRVKQEMKPAMIIAIAVVGLAVLGAVGYFALGGRVGQATPTNLGLGQEVKAGELPEGVKYHDLGGSAGPGTGTAPTPPPATAPTGPR